MYRAIKVAMGPLLDPGLAVFFGPPPSASGVQVDEANALQLAAVYRAISLRANTMGSLPLPTYQHRDRRNVRALDHPVYRLLWSRPNPEMTSPEFRRTLTAHKVGWGGGFAEIERRKSGTPLALWPLTPDRMIVDRVGGRVVYGVKNPDGSTTGISAENVLHIKGLGFDGLIGYSVVRLAADTIGLGLAMERYGAALFKNGARPSGVITVPGRMKDTALKNLKSTWYDEHGGMSNANRVAILEEGMTWQQTALPPDDAQFLQSRKFGVEEVARWFDTPLHLLMSLDRATNNNIEQQSLEFWQMCIRGECVFQEAEYGRVLFRDEEISAGFYVKHDVDDMLRADSATRFAGYKTALESGWMNRNQVREKEGLDPIPGDAGELYTKVPGSEFITEEAGKRPALAGPQVTALQGLVSGAASRTIPVPALLPLLQYSFPQMTAAEAAAIVGAVEAAEPVEPTQPEPKEPIGKQDGIQGGGEA